MARIAASGEIVVARDDALYYYGIEEGRGAPRAYEAEKSSIEIWGDYVAVVCPPPDGSGSAGKTTDALARRRFGSTVDTLLSASTLVLLEGELRLVGHTETLLSPARAMLKMWGDLYVLTQDGKITRYHEKPLQQRLELLYQRNMYPLAIELAQKCGLNAEEHSAIYRRFGDHMYQKGDFDGAMAQYMRAMDATEPSQVIRKFLDTQRIHNLIQYLEQLHERRKATADHTTLLLNCYAKLKDIDKLEAFTKSPGDLKFDLETAILMCRQGGYYEQAAYLAKQHGETDLVVDILIEDAKQYDQALDWIWRQTPDVVSYGTGIDRHNWLDDRTQHIADNAITQTFPCLQKYARVLINHCPEDATQLFIDYYTGNYCPRTGPIPGEAVEPPAETQAATASGALAGAASAVQNLSSYIPLPYMGGPASEAAKSADVETSQAAQAKQPHHRRHLHRRQEENDRDGATNDNSLPPPSYEPPVPRTAFSSFIDHPDEFIVFLEACLEERRMTEANRTDLYTTLFEMYLYKANENKGQEHRQEWEAKARKLIEGEEVPMESSNVLLLSDLSNFCDGTMLVKEQSGLLLDIFRSYTQARDTMGTIKTLRKYGPREPQLYPAALAYLTSDPRILEEAGTNELTAVLNKIDEDKLMTPLQVVQTLSGQGKGAEKNSSAAVVGMIKPYIQQIIDRERREIASGRRRIAEYKTETEQLRTELVDLSSKPAVFQATRCTDCRLPLDLPAVHFLCKHSYHQRCLRSGKSNGNGSGQDVPRRGDSKEEAILLRCPQCSARNDVIRTYRLQQAEGAGRHEVFKADLERSTDRFGTVAEWFGRGVMGAARTD